MIAAFTLVGLTGNNLVVILFCCALTFLSPSASRDNHAASPPTILLRHAQLAAKWHRSSVVPPTPINVMASLSDTDPVPVGAESGEVAAATSGDADTRKPAATKSASKPAHQCKMQVPNCAVGVIIGAKGATINTLKATKGIATIRTRPVSDNPNSDHELVITGDDAEAIREVESIILFKIRSATKQLESGSRQLHSNEPKADRPNSMRWSAADVHKRPGKPARPASNFAQGRQREKQRDQNLEEKFKREREG